MSPRRCLFLVACAVVVAACSAGAENPSTTASTVPVTTAPPRTVPDPAALCNGYLVLLRSGDPGPLRQELEDPGLVADLETMLSSEGEFEAIAEAALRLEKAVVDRCADRFAISVEPAADDAAALTQFLEAVVAGNEARAVPVAWENVVAQFTWSGIPESEIEIEGNTATMNLGPNRTVICQASGGVVVNCRFE